MEVVKCESIHDNISPNSLNLASVVLCVVLSRRLFNSFKGLFYAFNLRA